MRKLSIIIILFASLAFLLTGALLAEEAAKKEDKKEATHEYVGAKKCKICHKDVHAAWSETGHATAFSKLSAEEQKKPECVKCHTTGKLVDGTVIENVECEACHGPGKDFKSPKIMNKKKWSADPEKQKKMALEAGLIIPDEKDCVRCHTKEGNVNFKEFKFAERKELVHAVKAKEEAKKEVKKEGGK
ncbi:MAG: hypothetical protein KAW46_07780 [candidate division Zixibacteria bacterium]|nr:hypothetical protein [candidate division Zixibacteria bacterium]